MLPNANWNTNPMYLNLHFVKAHGQKSIESFSGQNVCNSNK